MSACAARNLGAMLITQKKIPFIEVEKASQKLNGGAVQPG